MKHKPVSQLALAVEEIADELYDVKAQIAAVARLAAYRHERGDDEDRGIALILRRAADQLGACVKELSAEVRAKEVA